MIGTFLQIWGGLFYLLNKVLFALTECSTDTRQKRFQQASWIVYLIGLPAFQIIFWMESNWIAFMVEGGGSTAMVLGLVIASRDDDEAPKWLDWIARIAFIIGITASVYDVGHLTQLTQWLEIGLSIGFLGGIYLVAKKDPRGYLLYMFMNCSTAGLFYEQGFYWLVAQQIASLGFVIDAYRMNKRKSRSSS